jgi:hypothetical protein
MNQEKNPKAETAEDSSHTATTIEPLYKNKSNENGLELEYINRVTARTIEIYGVFTATAYYGETTCRSTTNSEPHDPEEP